MNADDPADPRRRDDRRTVDALRGSLDRDTGPAPALRGLAWGLLVAVVAAVVLFATVLVTQGRARQPESTRLGPMAAAYPPTTALAGPATPSGALSASAPEPVPPSGAAPGPAAPPAAAPPTADALPPRPPPGGLLPVSGALRSVDSRTPALLVLVNESDGAVAVQWVDYRGRRVSYGEVPVGDRITLETYVTHPWVVSDAAGEDLGVALPRAPESTVIVEETP